QVVDAVAVCPAGPEVDAVLVGPPPHRVALAAGPDELAGQPTGEGAPLLGVPGGHVVVERELVGQRTDEVGRRRCGQHDRPAGIANHAQTAQATPGATKGRWRDRPFALPLTGRRGDSVTHRCTENYSTPDRFICPTHFPDMNYHPWRWTCASSTPLSRSPIMAR